MRKSKPKYVPWSQLDQQAKARLLSEGHESNRPKPRDQERPKNLFAEDGSGWMDHYLLADVFSVPTK